MLLFTVYLHLGIEYRQWEKYVALIKSMARNKTFACDLIFLMKLEAPVDL